MSGVGAADLDGLGHKSLVGLHEDDGVVIHHLDSRSGHQERHIDALYIDRGRDKGAGPPLAVRVGELHTDRSRPQRLAYDGADIVHGPRGLRAALTGFDVDGLADAQEGQVFLISRQ